MRLSGEMTQENTTIGNTFSFSLSRNEVFGDFFLLNTSRTLSRVRLNGGSTTQFLMNYLVMVGRTKCSYI